MALLGENKQLKLYRSMYQNLDFPFTYPQSILIFIEPIYQGMQYFLLLLYFSNKRVSCIFFSLSFQTTKEERGLETSTLGLRFKVRDKHFKNGDLKLKCTAVIATIYWKSNEESVQGVRPQSALVSESRSSRNSGIEIH